MIINNAKCLLGKAAAPIRNHNQGVQMSDYRRITFCRISLFDTDITLRDRASKRLNTPPASGAVYQKEENHALSSVQM
jgi:hypothetical protein